MIQAPKGTRDILPTDSYRWQFVECKARDVFSRFGYKEIRTPVFEHTELFARGIGDETDIVQKEMYTFQDKSNRSLTLKPEGTAGVIRSCIEHNLISQNSSLNLYYITSCYRYERPQAGRYREFNQIGVETIGSNSPYTDLEVISMAALFLKELGLNDVEISINNIGCQECRPKYITLLQKYLETIKYKLCDLCKERMYKNPLRVIDCKFCNSKKFFEDAPSIIDEVCKDCENHFEKVKKGLGDLGLKYSIDSKIVRGLDYYTKTVFELILTDENNNKSVICGGGRYDNLVKELGGTEVQGVGFAFGFERLLSALESKKINITCNDNPQLFIVSIDEKSQEFTNKLAFELRKLKIRVGIDNNGKSVKSQMRLANKLSANCVIVIGDEEISSKKGKLKIMQSEDDNKEIETDLDAEKIAELFKVNNDYN